MHTHTLNNHQGSTYFKNSIFKIALFKCACFFGGDTLYFYLIKEKVHQFHG